MSGSKRLIDMTEAERIAWGTAEHDARVRDLAVARSAEGLKAAQAAAEGRRKLVGASKSQAAAAIYDAAIQRRRAEAAAASGAEGS